MPKPTTTPAAVTLPVSGAVVPARAAALTLKKIQQMETSCGAAFRADVYDGKRLIGTIEQDGNGGGTWFRHADVEARDLWESLVTEQAVVDPEWAFVAHEHLANNLFEEVALFKEMNRKRNGVVMLDGNREAILVFNAPLDDRLRAYVRREFEGQSPMVWVKGEGWAQP